MTFLLDYYRLDCIKPTPGSPNFVTLLREISFAHEDLCEMNILINFETGNITGIVELTEARILPFGFALWGLENIPGYMNLYAMALL